MIDMAGLAQKGGAVYSHIRVAKSPADIHALRVSAGKADLILGCDLVVSGAKKVLAAARDGHTIFVANTAEVMPGDFARSTDFFLPTERLKKAIRVAAGAENAHFFDATRTAAALFGNSLGANMFMLGFAYQHGGLPVSAEAVERAIEPNGQAVAMNVAAFRWGRRAAHDPEFVRATVEKTRGGATEREFAQDLDAIVEKRAAFLAAYQDKAYAERYRRRVASMRSAEEKAVPGSTALTEAVARNLFKLMAIKDEYEVARLYTDGSFRKQLAAEFEHYDRLEFHLAPPVLNRRGADGRLRKSKFGPWMEKAFYVLATLKALRGTPFDLFGYSEERRMERRLLSEYESDLDRIADVLSAERIEAAVALASVPSLIRGFGDVKAANATKAAGERERLMVRLNNGPEAAKTLQAAE
jgi:indolepyruvate ferredoxin oxidoreductase